jgi:hypothetical protein
MSLFLLGNISMTFVRFQSSVDIPHGLHAKPSSLLPANTITVLKV